MRPLQEKLRYILLFGKIVREGDEWVFRSAPDGGLIVCRDASRWRCVEIVYDLIKEI